MQDVHTDLHTHTFVHTHMGIHTPSQAQLHNHNHNQKTTTQWSAEHYLARASSAHSSKAHTLQPSQKHIKWVGNGTIWFSGCSAFRFVQVRPTFLSPPIPPRFSNVGVSPVSARAGNERGRCLLPSVHDSYNTPPLVVRRRDPAPSCSSPWPALGLLPR